MASLLEPKNLSKRIVAISISDSENLGAFGFRKKHLADAFCETCRHLLADGAGLIYGGDLRREGYTELLFELIATYRPRATQLSPVFDNCLPWPVHMNMHVDELDRRREELPVGAHISCLSIEGEVIRRTSGSDFAQMAPSKSDWVHGLSSMRKYSTQMAHARVVLGGKVSEYLGSMPGVAEEAMLTLRAKAPLYLVGGFGGCTADICVALGLREPLGFSEPTEWLRRFHRSAELNNGLDESENRLLAMTPHLDQAVALILRGTKRRLGN